MANLYRANARHRAGAGSAIETSETRGVYMYPRTEDSSSTYDHTPAAAQPSRAMGRRSGSNP